MSIFQRLSTSGLSPLARGTLVNGFAVIEFERFIPAGAGNTKGLAIVLFSTSVYPRWRGEHCWKNWCRSPALGLSPLARGTLGKLYRRKWRGRFIPAGAGNTSKHAKTALKRPVYPRWRGEHINPPALNQRSSHRSQYPDFVRLPAWR